VPEGATYLEKGHFAGTPAREQRVRGGVCCLVGGVRVACTCETRNAYSQFAIIRLPVTSLAPRGTLR
jgi:hypothetical protein